MGFVATVATRWFEARRGLVTGVLTAASATGQLIFLPVVAEVTTRHGWRWASLIVAAAALSVVPLVLRCSCANCPQDIGLNGIRRDGRSEPAVVPDGELSSAAFDGLRIGARVPARSGCWPASFAICGMTTNGLDRHALHPGRQRPRHAHHGGGRPAGHHRRPRRGRHGRSRAG